jgi:LuxR family maltose regulon positive regulatory protein
MGARTPRTGKAVAHPFDFLESKIRVPATRSGTISRTALVNRLRATSSTPVVSVVAPAGYGKTTLLAQWAQRDSRHFAWATLDDRDNDPVVLLRHIAAALDRDEPLEPPVIAALRSPGASVWTAAVPRLARALATRSPIVLVLDDFNALHSRGALEIVSALIDDEATDSIVVLAGRVPPRLALAQLRADASLLELGVGELALTRREAELLVRATGVQLSESRMAELVEQCEGWAAALYLAALAIRDGDDRTRAGVRIAGDDRYLADYFRSEYLSRMRRGPLRFLRRTSVLEQMCGDLCDAVLEDTGSDRELEKIERANLFLVPLDNRRVWYRYHHLFRELLQRELVEHEPEVVPVLHRRAADWFQAKGDAESAFEHVYAAGDLGRAAGILASIAFAVYRSGRVATLERWLRRFQRVDLLERYPALALHGSRVHAARGRAEQAERWLAAAERGGSATRSAAARASLQPGMAVMRAYLCRDGADQMLLDADAALAELPETSDWRPAALVAQASALLLLGEPQQADGVFAAAADCAASLECTDEQVVALAERALIADEHGDHARADELAGDVRRLVAESDAAGYAARAADCAATSRVMLRQGRWNEARAALTAALDVLPFVTVAIPWLAVRLRLEIARGFVTLRDGDAAQELLTEIADILRRVPLPETLAPKAEELEREVDLIPRSDGARQIGLTPAELRLLPLLATHLSFREIGQKMYVSRNTVKTQAISVYRKLGVSSRSEAVAEAQRLGLGESLRVVVDDDRQSARTALPEQRGAVTPVGRGTAPSPSVRTP